MEHAINVLFVVLSAVISIGLVAFNLGTYWASKHTETQEARIFELEALLEKFRIEHFECYVCKAALVDDVTEPPRCTDCYISDEVVWDWQERNDQG